jgi:O-antigen ligase
MHLINSDKRNYINLVSYLVLSLPLSLIFSRFTADLSIVILSIMFFFIRGENKIFENKFLSIAIIFIVCASISSVLSNHIIYSLKSSLLHLRFIFFILTVSILFLYCKKNFLKNLFYIFLSCYLVLLFDATIQFIFKQNIFGYTVNPINRVSSLFFDELILGSYLSRLFPLLIFLYVYLKLRLNKYFMIYFLFHLYFVVFVTGERLSFMILNIYYLLFIIFLFKTKLNKFFFIFSTIIIFSLILVFSSSFKARSSFDNTISQLTSFNYSYCQETKTNIISNPKLSESWNYVEDKSFIPNCHPIVKIFDYEIYYIFTIMHFNHYLSAIEMFKDNKYFGVGPKIFRKICNNKDYYLNEFSCSSHPHNYYIQLLSETGLVGFSLISIIYLSFIYLFFNNITKHNNKDFLSKYILISSFLVNFFPFFPGGNFFNNWNSIIYTLPLGFLIALYNTKKNNG